jgi:hypothetical protein
MLRVRKYTACRLTGSSFLAVSKDRAETDSHILLAILVAVPYTSHLGDARLRREFYGVIYL